MINTMENIAPEELAALDLFQNCRLCLAKDKVSVDIFNEAAEVRLLYCKIVSCLPLHFSKEDDKLPRKICTQCNEKVDNFYNFWTLTAKTQKTLLDWVQQREIVTTKIKTENIAPSEISFKQEYIDNSDVDDNDRYDDDNESEEDVEPTTVVKTLCDETDGESAGPSTVNIKSRRGQRMKCENGALDMVKMEEVLYGATTTSLPSSWSRDVDHVCKKCGFTSDSATFLFIHSLDCKADFQIFECIVCKKLLKSRRSMVYHMRKKHSRTSIKLKNSSEVFECDLCKKAFKHKCLIQEHMLIHHLNSPYSCDLCDKQFKNKSKFHEHIKKVHLGVVKEPKKNFACTYCPLKFRTSQYLSDHQHVHTGSRMYECDICHKEFFIKGSLQSHIRFKHKMPQPTSNELVLRVTCDICGKSYSHKRGLDYHYKVHHGDGKLTCNICGKKVCEKRSLLIHMNTHSGEKPHSCEICGRSFTTKAYLKVHTLTHTGETPHVCHICTKSFTQRSSLTLHYRTHHPGVTPSTLAKYKKT